MNRGIVMKGLLSLLSCLALLSDTHGQGRVTFANTSTTLISTNAIPGGVASGLINQPVGSYYFALFSAPSGTVDTTFFAFTGYYGTNTVTAGRFNGGQPPVPGYEPGNFVSLLVRGWSANAGHDYSSVIDYLDNPTFDAWYGESQIATVLVGGGAIPIPFIFGSQLGQIPGFTLEMHTIPEPSSAALVGLGLTAMWLLGRRSR